jgi:hypothetical protein
VEVIIRGYHPRDAAGLADVFFRSVRLFERKGFAVRIRRLASAMERSCDLRDQGPRGNGSPI